MDGDDYVIYPVVCYNAFLFSPLPVVIPILPNLFPMISSKNNDLKIIIKSRRKFSPDDITCTIDGKQVFPYSIDSLHVFYTSDGKKMTNWHNCWNEDSIYKYPHPSPYKTPNNWNTLPSFENECEVRYYYNVKHISISEIEISFADGKEPLRLRLKKGLFYTWSYPIVYR
jgi:hypothetical protein